MNHTAYQIKQNTHKIAKEDNKEKPNFGFPVPS